MQELRCAFSLGGFEGIVGVRGLRPQRLKTNWGRQRPFDLNEEAHKLPQIPFDNTQVKDRVEG